MTLILLGVFLFALGMWIRGTSGWDKPRREETYESWYFYRMPDDRL